MGGEDPNRLRWVKTLRCLARGTADTCDQVVEAHHAGRRGLGRKAHDNTAVPLCVLHHRQFHDGSGAFAGWNKDKRRQWSEAAIAATQAAWAVDQRQTLPDWA